MIIGALVNMKEKIDPASMADKKAAATINAIVDSTQSTLCLVVGILVCISVLCLVFGKKNGKREG